MARNKLIAKYSALNTDNLPQRIYDIIKNYIASHGIENLPELELSGRWTGKLDISNGGWRGDFDLLYPVLAMCRVDRHGEVFPDMAKIKSCVERWIEYLTTPDESDEYMGVSDETFQDSDYIEDDANDFRSAAYAAEINSFLNADNPDMLEHDHALSEIDDICCGEKDSTEGNRMFEDGFNAMKITNAEDLRKIMEAMNREAAEEEVYPGYRPILTWMKSRKYLRVKKNPVRHGWNSLMISVTAVMETSPKITTAFPIPKNQNNIICASFSFNTTNKCIDIKKIHFYLSQIWINCDKLLYLHKNLYL